MNPLRSQFMLRPDIHYLNFGSFGATPIPVFDRYQSWQRLLEAEPVQFIAFDGAGYLATSRKALATYLHVDDPDDLVYVTNPSYAVNTVAASLKLAPCDEVLATDIEYGACDRAWDFHCERHGAVYRKQHIRLPVTDRESFLDDLFAGVNDRTRVLFISHLTSATALRLPVEEACKRAKAMGLITFVDGAHAPGHVPLNLNALDADFYTGACHKWMMAPKGCSFLYTQKEMQPLLAPLVVSWGYKAATPSHSMFLDHHQMNGTRDFSAFLTVPDCIDFMQQYDWEAVSARCRSMVRENAPRFHELLGTAPISPLNEEWLGQMVSIPIRTTAPEILQRRLFTEYRIEIPVMRQGSDVYLRYSLNGFNTLEDLDALFHALTELGPGF
ncbi:MAG: aminotransferase class V-fold PLP-dependent enzyme [bacterium]